MYRGVRWEPEAEDDIFRRVRVRVRVPCLEPTWWRMLLDEEAGETGGSGDLLEPGTDAASCGGGESGVDCGAGMLNDRKSWTER